MSNFSYFLINIPDHAFQRWILTQTTTPDPTTCSNVIAVATATASAVSVVATTAKAATSVADVTITVAASATAQGASKPLNRSTGSLKPALVTLYSSAQWHEFHPCIEMQAKGKENEKF